MKQVYKLLKIIAAIIALIAAIITIIDFTVNFDEFKPKFLGILNNIDFMIIGQILQIIGLFIVVSGVCIYIFIKIYNRYEPSRGIIDIISPLLLSKDIIGDPEQKFDNKLRLFIYIRIGVITLIIGLISIIFTKIY